MPAEFAAFIFELTLEELAQLAAGSDEKWQGKALPRSCSASGPA